MTRQRAGAMPWAADAACRGEDPNLFHPVDAAPLAICERCPVRAACLDHGLRHERLGVWGGSSERQRARLRKAIGIELVSLDPVDDPAKAGDEHLEAS